MQTYLIRRRGGSATAQDLEATAVRGWKRGGLMLVAVTAAIALGAPAVAAASPPPPTPTHGFTPSIVVPGLDTPPFPVPAPAPTSLVITVAFKGGYSTPASTPDQTASTIADQIGNGLNPWLAQVSRGRFSGYSRGPIHREVTVQPKKQLCSDGWINEVSDLADSKSTQRGNDPDNYNAVIYYFKHVPCGWGGRADFPENGHRVFLNGNVELTTLAHEFGHHLGLGHAGSEFCVDRDGNPVSLSGPVELRCTQQEYGDTFNAMGDDDGVPESYAAAQLDQLGWRVGTATISAGDPAVTETLTRLDENAIGSTQALRLIDGVSTLWLEYRLNSFSVSHRSLIVKVEQTSLASPPARHAAPFLLDMSPGDGDVDRTPGSHMSQELPVGQAWSNPLGNMTITLNSAGPDSASVTIQSVPGPVPDPPPGPGPGPGPGTVAVPNVRGQTLSVAERDITAAGLVRGTIGTTIDCDDIDRVVSQSPVAGIHLPPGGTVDLKLGIARPGGCGTPE